MTNMNKFSINNIPNTTTNNILMSSKNKNKMNKFITLNSHKIPNQLKKIRINSKIIMSKKKIQTIQIWMLINNYPLKKRMEKSDFLIKNLTSLSKSKNKKNIFLF